MKFQKILFLLGFLGFGLFVKAQVKPNIKEFIIADEDTIIISKLPEVEILAFKDYDEKLRYYILKRKVLKVYPYALKAKKRLVAIQVGLDSIPKRRHKKRYTKEVSNWVKEEYAEQLSDLQRKKFWLEKEIQMAEFIISAVKSEITPQAFIKGLIQAELDD